MLEADVEVDRREFPVAVAFRVDNGERLALFGPSGSGKTTVLEAIAGLTPLKRGRVVLAGRVLTRTTPPRRAEPPWRRHVGLLRQDPGLFPHLSVRQNLCYGMGSQAPGARPGGVTADEVTRIARELGIESLLDDRPARLSGGQAHRVALGRLLLANRGALLLDEPYTGLDAGLRRTLTGLVLTVVSQRQVPAVLVAHELPEAQAFADRMAVIDRGRLLQTGSPAEVVARPATRRVAELVGYRGFVGCGSDRLHVVAGVHPERVVPGSHPERGLVVLGSARTVRPSGAGWDAEVTSVDGASGAFWCHLPDPPPIGTQIPLTLLEPPRYGPDDVLLTGADGVRA